MDEKKDILSEALIQAVVGSLFQEQSYFDSASGSTKYYGGQLSSFVRSLIGDVEEKELVKLVKKEFKKNDTKLVELVQKITEERTIELIEKGKEYHGSNFISLYGKSVENFIEKTVVEWQKENKEEIKKLVRTKLDKEMKAKNFSLDINIDY